MNVDDAVRTLLAVRAYQERPVPEDVLRQILEAGRLTASSMNGQPWHFIVVRDRKTLTALAGFSPSGPYIASAPLAIVVAVDRTPYAISDASRAIQDMMLVAWGAGVGSNWVGFGGMAEVKALLGIPAALDLLAIIPFGYPAHPVGQGRKKRNSLVEIAHQERWGQPYAP